ncbi:sodium-coupled neutral amino acid transporter 10 [Pelomyxa schiedti]|nr:sodium-coupled neutral amino acid transporter 10 [Pelomyxa schiedti]
MDVVGLSAVLRQVLTSGQVGAPTASFGEDLVLEQDRLASSRPTAWSPKEFRVLSERAPEVFYWSVCQGLSFLRLPPPCLPLPLGPSAAQPPAAPASSSSSSSSETAATSSTSTSTSSAASGGVGGEWWENVGIPRRPFYVRIAERVCQWAQGGRVPLDFVKMNLLEEPVDDVKRLEQYTDKVTAMSGSWATASDDQRRALLLDFVSAIGSRGLLTLLGLRCTKGSILRVPPGPLEIIQAFNLPHAPNSSARLTVGGRALSKHCERSRDGWWGDGLSGEESVKNRRAETALRNILSDPVWLNTHMLPHDIPIYEIRNREGYGARWSVDPPFEFRGFLEPQMADGHEKGWIH